MLATTVNGVQVPIRKRGIVVAVMLLDEENLNLVLRPDGGLRYLILERQGYVSIRVYAGELRSKRRRVPVHRLVMGLGVGDPREVDHINRIKHDNRRSNLRVVDRLGNAQNQGLHRAAGPGRRGRPRTSSYRGVIQLANGSWRAAVGSPPRRWTATFGTEAEAAAAAAAKRRALLPFAVD